MNLNWNTAPTWANYAAMDENEDWFWYELKPEIDYDWGCFLSPENGRHDFFTTLGPDCQDWKKSLTQRPKNQNAPLCPKCYEQVNTIEVSPDYSFACAHCDEDFLNIEVIAVK